VRHVALLTTFLALLTAACGSGGAVAEGNVEDLVPPAKYPTHFSGLPPQGAHASTPTTGKLMISLNPTPYATWNVYADGRMIWQKWTHAGDPIVIPQGERMVDIGYVQQRLTPQGVQLLRSRILSTGLFGHNLRLKVGRNHFFARDRVRRGDRMVSVTTTPYVDPTWNEHIPKATPAQMRGLAQIDTLVADPAAWLPASAWADREIRAFVPSHYMVAFDRSAPDTSKLPSPLRQLLLHYKKLLRHGCQGVTTGEARTLLQALVEAGIPPSHNHAWVIDFGLAGFRSIPSDLHFHPALPPEFDC
jgi:hypothetical protein